VHGNTAGYAGLPPKVFQLILNVCYI